MLNDKKSKVGMIVNVSVSFVGVFIVAIGWYKSEENYLLGTNSDDNQPLMEDNIDYGATTNRRDMRESFEEGDRLDENGNTNERLSTKVRKCNYR